MIANPREKLTKDGWKSFDCMHPCWRADGTLPERVVGNAIGNRAPGLPHGVQLPALRPSFPSEMDRDSGLHWASSPVRNKEAPMWRTPLLLSALLLAGSLLFAQD